MRIRTYAPSFASADTVFVERKTHNESWVQSDSVKQRFELPQRDVRAFLDGQLDVEAELGGDAQRVALASETAALIKKRKLQPKVRTCYRRTAFQSSTSNAVRITFDVSLTLVAERSERIPADRWCLAANASLGPLDVFDFPHAILEVKLQQPAPVWLDALLQSGLIVEAPSFSKFCTSLALLYPWIPSMLPPCFDEPTLAQSIVDWYARANKVAPEFYR